MAKARETAETLKNGDATAKSTEQLRKLGEELTNVPEGFKVTAARYAAMAAGDYREAASPSGGAGGAPLPTPAAPAPAASMPIPTAAPASPPPVYVEVKLNQADLVREVVVQYEKARYQRDGVPRSTQ
jgi:hypothetical protein